MKRMLRRLACVAAIGMTLFATGDAAAIIGMPWTPLSYAGVARRTVRRSAYMGAVGAAAVGPAAVVGPAAYGVMAPRPVLPVGCYVGRPCGGVIYQPVYQGTTVVYVPQ
jgi:hypothetical protein